MGDWMLAYGFEAINNDHTMFKFTGKYGTLTVALYVDDGLVASTSVLMRVMYTCNYEPMYQCMFGNGVTYMYVGIR